MLKAKLARNAAEPTTRDVLKEKRGEGVAPSTSALPEDELAILKAKRGNSGASADVGSLNEVETLKAKLADNVAATEGETAPGAPEETRVAPARPAATRVAESRRQSAFDLAFVLVLFLWGVAIAVTLTAGPQWWLFIFCLVATASALLLGLFDSTAFGKKFREK